MIRESIFTVTPEILFFGKSGPKNQKCLFNLKFGTQTNLNKQNLMVISPFHFQTRHTLFGQIQSVSKMFFKVKSGTQTNFNMQNFVMMLFFVILDSKYPFCKNRSQLSKLLQVFAEVVQVDYVKSLPDKLVKIPENASALQIFL